MPSSFKLFFFLIFLSYIEIILSHGRGSCSSSCGNLQNIRYPFHLRGDPTECGGPDFELNCEGNNTILEIHRKKFYVIDISYRDSEIMLVDVGLAKGNCVNLPERSVDPDDYLGVFRFGRAYIVLLIIGRFLFAPLCVLSFLAYNLFKLSVPVDIIERFLQNQKALSPSRYSYNDIITITSNFKEKLGQGGFGSVYKGRLPGGYLVAVKMLGKSMGDGEDFINEVSTIGRIHHVNVVQLVGFCAEGSYRALVYEYMANGSLDKYIFSSNKKNRILNMDKLLEIALSVAKGLHYLHQGCNMGILHFDIKPHNILLDHKFTPKISDFGLAKLHPKDHSLVFMSAARGTIGYIAPELISRSFGTISHKSDVYSFGMLLMDMAGGRRHNDLKAENSSQVYYPSWIYDKLQKTELSENFEIFEIDDLEMKLCKVGLCCIQTRPVDRPSMINVVEMLEADVNSLQMPPKPFFSSSHSMSQRNICMDYSVHELPIILENL
ncbi:LEAF RUST 10 DISEASE-RESISTANCE LOCUS RECEPTOR-LIKE PROTEIN KINASE-like 2.5 isoform X2 [Dendrobium catenatum]|uniref:LEAF RUST 10 DISEASE-RESISTANCE LOCUS RECEPTOR-LIKE PROTEIN KINASE-like 2.5 isoform X2 n=1 Tax=Dendrobium catenatum TaxID=906689 RepID=UPI00109F5F0F|nr:LEAF RUST 10 DISEASE-RESISTANCE LOCUS RECEPTOR-LIKE PROTEIN KINASE-like 2.5 isoform X2 [Dendrobium catenatum]